MADNMFDSLPQMIDGSLGQNGSLLITDTNAHTGNFFALSFVVASTLTALTGNVTGTVTGITYPAGFTIYGNFTSITLASGTAFAYNM
jgi:hypothetical protein